MSEPLEVWVELPDGPPLSSDWEPVPCADCAANAAEVERLRAELARRDEQIAAVRRFAESAAISAKALGRDDRAWLDVLILVERES